MTQEVTFKLSENDFKSALNEVLKSELEERIYGKFYNSFIGTKAVADIHGISERTVQRYINDGLIHPEPRITEKGRYKFRLSYVLKLDFKELREQLKINNSKYSHL